MEMTLDQIRSQWEKSQTPKLTITRPCNTILVLLAEPKHRWHPQTYAVYRYFTGMDGAWHMSGDRKNVPLEDAIAYLNEICLRDYPRS